jgi:hypothetical protein
MLQKIISGGQTGADRAAWRAARRFGIATGGWMPRGYQAEDGAHPEFAGEFGATELPAGDNPARNERNVRDSDATLWFGETTTAGAQETVEASLRSGKPCLTVYPGADFQPTHVATWIRDNQVRTLNVAGNRETDEPGIADRAERFLGEVLLQLGHERS